MSVFILLLLKPVARSGIGADMSETYGLFSDENMVIAAPSTTVLLEKYSHVSSSEPVSRARVATRFWTANVGDVSHGDGFTAFPRLGTQEEEEDIDIGDIDIGDIDDDDEVDDDDDCVGAEEE